MKINNFIQLSVVVLCFVQNSRSDETLISTFNDIYETCLIRLNTDCIQPKALQWLNKVIEKREISITDDLTIVKDDSVTIPKESIEHESARDNRINVISKVDEFLATHYLNIRYPKAVIISNVPSFMASTINRLIPESIQVPLEEGNLNEGNLIFN